MPTYNYTALDNDGKKKERDIKRNIRKRGQKASQGFKFNTS